VTAPTSGRSSRPFRPLHRAHRLAGIIWLDSCYALIALWLGRSAHLSAKSITIALGIALIGLVIRLGASGPAEPAQFPPPLPLPARLALAALPLTADAPADNPTTPEKVTLGRLLYWDPILSGNKDVACATCHHPDFGYAENVDLSIGVNGVGLGAARRFASGNAMPFVKRNSQTVLNSAFNGIVGGGQYDPASAPMFWDLRAKGLEAQALEPIKTREEMRADAYPEDQALDKVVARLAAIAEYRDLFAKAFGGKTPVTAANLAKAIASFERTLLANNSPFDRYMRGDRMAMSPPQLSGMASFQKGGCINCHGGPMFSDFKLHVLGVPDNPKLSASDTGVGTSYAFRTPTLRNLALTAPYTHSGAFLTLQQMLAFYEDVSGAGAVMPKNPHVARGQFDPLLLSLNTPEPRVNILQFLQALNDPNFDRTIPSRVPSGLAPGGNIK
jgi:cytochrome c peroxidase